LHTLSENFLVFQIYGIWCWKSLILGEARGIVEFKAAVVFFRGKFAPVHWEVATFFLAHDAAAVMVLE